MPSKRKNGVRIKEIDPNRRRMAQIAGSLGGENGKGASKRRDPAHYARIAEARRNAAFKRRMEGGK